MADRTTSSRSLQGYQSEIINQYDGSVFLLSDGSYIFLVENIVVDDGFKVRPRRGASVSISGVRKSRELFIEPGFNIVHDLLEGVRHHLLHLVVSLVKLHHRRSIEVPTKNDKICFRDLDKSDQFIHLFFSDLVVAVWNISFSLVGTQAKKGGRNNSFILQNQFKV